MAKANVLARQIRAYRRRVVELQFWIDRPLSSRHGAARDEQVRYLAMLGGAEGALANFLSGRVKGPWAKESLASVA